MSCSGEIRVDGMNSCTTSAVSPGVRHETTRIDDGQNAMADPARTMRRLRRVAGAAVLAVAALYFFVGPAVLVTIDLRDARSSRGAIPAAAWRWHRALTPRYEAWARQRVREGRGATVALRDVAGTEWPMFGTVFFLGATEQLQDAHRRDPTVAPAAPAQYAAGAVQAAAELLLDPANATWVRAHWGDDYLQRENVFYRMLLILGLTSHARITGATTHMAVLRQQVESLAGELAAAPYGMLDDYPGESYPTDVLWAVAAIRGADAVLGTDHAALAERFLAHCRSPLMLGRLGLLPFQVDARSGRGLDDSRGCSNAGILVQAPRLSVDQAQQWYGRFAEHFWQESALLSGFTEYPRDTPNSWMGDVDSGPIVLGYGFAASAFGLAAARANGRFDHAAPLAALALAGSWPLPDGTLLLPRLLSNAVDAPFLGEAAMIYIFTRTPESGVRAVDGPDGLPGLVPLIIIAYLLAGAILLFAAWRDLRAEAGEPSAWREAIAFAAWAVLLAAAVVTAADNPMIALILVLIAYALPRRIAGRDGGRSFDIPILDEGTR